MISKGETYYIDPNAVGVHDKLRKFLKCLANDDTFYRPFKMKSETENRAKVKPNTGNAKEKNYEN